VKVYHYDNLESLKAHVLAFITAYNFAKHLKALRWRTPYQLICEASTKDPSITSIFKIDRTSSFRDHTPSLAARLQRRAAALEARMDDA
jgi:hypothetical protein